MMLPNTIRRRLLPCAIGLCLWGCGLAFAQETPGGRDELDWSVPGEAPTEPVSIDSMTPGAPAEELMEGQRPRSVRPAATPGGQRRRGGTGRDEPFDRGRSHLEIDGLQGRIETVGGDELGIDLVQGSATLNFAELDPFSISPQAGVLFLDGPTRTDLPARLYSGQVEFRWFDQISQPLFYELAFVPGVFTDGAAWGGEALRLQGRAVGYLAFSQETQLVLGATYLDRQDVPVLPVVGLIHSPGEDVKIEMMFPRPRILKRIANDSAGASWVYLSGELGGGAWAIERSGGRDDIANYRDYRLLAGFERRFAEGGTGKLEAGYVFGRQLRYDSGRGDFDPAGTFMVRCGLSR